MNRNITKFEYYQKRALIFNEFMINQSNATQDLFYDRINNAKNENEIEDIFSELYKQYRQFIKNMDDDSRTKVNKLLSQSILKGNDKPEQSKLNNFQSGLNEINRNQRLVPPLPKDVHKIIASYVTDKKTLGRYAQACTLFNAIAQPRLDQIKFNTVPGIVVNVLFLGDMGAGKHDARERIVYDTFVERNYTNGRNNPDCLKKNMMVNKDKVTLKLHSTCDMERCNKVNSRNYFNKDIIAVYFDATDRISFDNVAHWLGEIDRYANDNVIRVLVCNKVDKIQSNQDWEVQPSEIKKFADANGMLLAFNSSKSPDCEMVKKCNEVYAGCNNYLEVATKRALVQITKDQLVKSQASNLPNSNDVTKQDEKNSSILNKLTNVFRRK